VTAQGMKIARRELHECSAATIQQIVSLPSGRPRQVARGGAPLFRGARLRVRKSSSISAPGPRDRGVESSDGTERRKTKAKHRDPHSRRRLRRTATGRPLRHRHRARRGAAPEGFGSSGTHAVNQTLYKNPMYNAVTDFELISELPLLLVAQGFGRRYPAGLYRLCEGAPGENAI
jgi:hypothetical protein